ncbi:hypothetical protein TNCV_844801 [Trichonephila clavipes]|uniref:Uncharacterized protein n=1 Tax=Trichonephila clavipes TaxID=2585209 RepID=A0A8X7BKP3_TRICX|nr:hypothetical protein TNCV_844801 [Trichonephila clavipes]
MWSMVAQRLTQITPPAATSDQLLQRVEASWSALRQEHILSLFESMLNTVVRLHYRNAEPRMIPRDKRIASVMTSTRSMNKVRKNCC